MNLCINQISLSGCTDFNYLEFTPNATIDDGSCQNLLPLSNCNLPQQWSGNTGNNMTVFFSSSVIQSLPELSFGAYIVAISSSSGLESSLCIGTNSI